MQLSPTLLGKQCNLTTTIQFYSCTGLFVWVLPADFNGEGLNLDWEELINLAGCCRELILNLWSTKSLDAASWQATLLQVWSCQATTGNYLSFLYMLKGNRKKKQKMKGQRMLWLHFSGLPLKIVPLPNLLACCKGDSSQTFTSSRLNSSNYSCSSHKINYTTSRWKNFLHQPNHPLVYLMK